MSNEQTKESAMQENVLVVEDYLNEKNLPASKMEEEDYSVLQLCESRLLPSDRMETNVNVIRVRLGLPRLGLSPLA